MERTSTAPPLSAAARRLPGGRELTIPVFMQMQKTNREGLVAQFELEAGLSRHFCRTGDFVAA